MYGISLKVWGDYACFTRPEMKVERVSYDVITPSSARGILEAIHWKPGIAWKIDEIWVLNPIMFSNIRRNEVSSKIPAGNIGAAIGGNGKMLYQSSNADRQQRATIMLKNVSYVIKAHFEMTEKAGETDTEEKHYNIFLRRARQGQFFHQPYFGCREFPAKFELLENGLPQPEKVSKDLGWMLYDINFRDKENLEPIFFRAEMIDGVIRIPQYLAGGERD